jgi:hypothetical protein
MRRDHPPKSLNDYLVHTSKLINSELAGQRAYNLKENSVEDKLLTCQFTYPDVKFLALDVMKENSEDDKYPTGDSNSVQSRYTRNTIILD